MLKRTLTGIGIIIITAGVFCLRQFVDYRLFNLLFFLLAVIGTFEILRALGDRVTALAKCVVWAYALALVPLMTFFDNVWAIVTFIASLAVIGTFVLEFDKVSIESVGAALLALFYPTGMLGAAIALNVAGDNGFVALLLVFVVTPFADTGAYLLGSLIKGPKLSPVISPHKTISGFIGGLFSGALGSCLVWLIFPAAKGLFVSADWEWVIYLIIGLVATAVSVFGDLTEGAMKRKLGIKDMGNILPGHGGVLDRIDSTMFVAVFVYFIFAIIKIAA